MSRTDTSGGSTSHTSTLRSRAGSLHNSWGWNPIGRLHDPEPDQVPTERLGELRKMLIWIYGSKKDGVSPVVQFQNPDIKRLGEVLSHAQGRHVLETTRDLSAAHASTEPMEFQFTTSLITRKGQHAESCRRSQSL